MDIRQYIALLRRQLMVVVVTALVVGISATAFSLRQPPVYEATATLLALDSDPSVRLFENVSEHDRGRHIAAQEKVVTSFAVAREASTVLPGSDPSQLVDQVSATADAETGLVLVRARHRVPTEAQAVADAFATAYVEVAGRSSALRATKLAEDVQSKLDALQAQMAELGSSAGGSEGAPPPGVPSGEWNESFRATRLALGAQYQKLLDHQQELLIRQNLGQQGPRLISTAARPQNPLGVGKVKTSLLGAFSGLLLGIAFAVLRDHLDDRVRGRDHLERDLDVPVLRELPREKLPKDWGAEPAVVHRSHGELAEAARALRTTLHLAGNGQLRKLVVTSPSPGDGKSFVAIQLAVAYARAGFKTVLVSSDLRRPSLERVLSIEYTGGGLAGFLAAPPPRVALQSDTEGESADTSLPEDLVVPCVVPNLFLVPSGPLPPNPAELLAGDRMAHLLDVLGLWSHMVILDTPSVLAVTDAVLLGSLADGVLVVAADGQTAMPGLRRTLATLATPSVRTVGLVVNKVRRRRSREARYYGLAPLYGVSDNQLRRLPAARGQEAPAGEREIPSEGTPPVDEGAAASDVAPAPDDEARVHEVPSTVQ